MQRLDIVETITLETRINVGNAERVSQQTIVTSEAVGATMQKVEEQEYGVWYFGQNDEPCLQEEDYPALARVWDNDDDEIFDTM